MSPNVVLTGASAVLRTARKGGSELAEQPSGATRAAECERLVRELEQCPKCGGAGFISAAALNPEAAARDQRAGSELSDTLLQVAHDRAQAAADRARAAADRLAAERERASAARLLVEAWDEIEAATTDHLTGAWTRRFGLRLVEREIERARRTGGTLTIAFVDVDHLKEINDSQGHLVGDSMLRLVSETLRTHLRPYDVVVRYGGDEFVCAMPNVGKKEAAERMSAIAAKLSHTETTHSISFGLTRYQPDDGLEELIERADADLLAVRRVRREGAP